MLLYLAGAYLLAVLVGGLILYSCCVVAGRADDRAREALKRERLIRAAKDQIDTSGGGFR
jgi:hypothetical protein